MSKLAMAAALCSIAACGGDDGPETVNGMTVDMFGTDVGTYVRVDGDVVVEVGITMPVATSEAANDQPAGTFEGFGLDWPSEASTTVFTHSLINFSKDGIGAPWDAPFFLMHYYFVDADTRLSTTCPAEEVDSAQLPSQYNLLPLTAVPDGGGCLAGEGLHAVDAAADEMQDPPGDFTHSMWIGYIDGELAFLEPFITTASLIDGADFEMTLRQPDTFPAVAEGLLYPARFTGTKVGDSWELAFTDFFVAD